ncbi:lytic murein transglycosylase [Bartonella sp. HY761]|uniref:lytic murein transglycosylase n=1 Tax=Bartonella sp. HY761 TaxID=2979330 RepID=UPI00220C25B6|nr:lytic murein transglycosylase [Bartonella sp. HY761]UXN07157.1 lytic murein transglycosylase [Bartonella sp. HY761]
MKMLFNKISLIALSAMMGFSFIQNANAQNTPEQAANAAQSSTCGSNLKDWLDGVAKEAKAQGVSDHSIQELYDAQIDEKVLGRDRSQAIFNLTFADFSKRVISDNRLQKGRENLVKYKAIFDKAEETYGVPGPVIAAFWGLETDFGAVQGNFNTLNSLVTLAHDCRRPDLFRPQVIALLKLFDTGVVDSKTQGAWAGEIGQMQLLPKDYLERGVDGDGDGKVDLRNSTADAIMTAARMISELGWKRGQPWLEEVRVTGQNVPWQEATRQNRKPHSQWADWGISGLKGPLGADDGDASLVLPMGRKGPAFLSYDNFDVFVEWNKSIVYATTVAYFAARLNGAPSFDLGNPDAGLSTDDMKALQEKLLARGHEIGKIDGVYGALTRDAVRAEQLRLNMPADAWPTQDLLEKL